MESSGTDMLELEAEAQRRVSVSLSKIEVALSEWDSAGKKPEELEGQVRYLRRFHEELSAWARDSLSGKKDRASTESRLRRFVEICRSIEAAEGGPDG